MIRFYALYAVCLAATWHAQHHHHMPWAWTFSILGVLSLVIAEAIRRSAKENSMPDLTQILLPLALFFNLAAIGPLRGFGNKACALSLLIASVLYFGAVAAYFV